MSEAAKARRRYRREEWATQTTLARLLGKHLDPQTTFWTSLENKPSSFLNGLLQKKRGVRSGLPDTMIVFRQRSIFVELKSTAGIPSKAQKQVRAELLAAGAQWWLARSVSAALMALRLSGVEFRRPWKPPELRAWEGPFDGSERRLPRHPAVRARQRAACLRWRARQRAREPAPQATTERADATAASA